MSLFAGIGSTLGTVAVLPPPDFRLDRYLPMTINPAPVFPAPRLSWLLAAAVVALLAAWIRFELVEPLARSAACAADPSVALCQLRAFVVMLFQGERVGWVALLITVLGGLARWRWLTGAGLLIGAAALMLYSVEPAAAAVLLATTLLLRRASKP